MIIPYTIYQIPAPSKIVSAFPHVVSIFSILIVVGRRSSAGDSETHPKFCMNHRWSTIRASSVDIEITGLSERCRSVNSTGSIFVDPFSDILYTCTRVFLWKGLIVESRLTFVKVLFWLVKSTQKQRTVLFDKPFGTLFSSLQTSEL